MCAGSVKNRRQESTDFHQGPPLNGRVNNTLEKYLTVTGQNFLCKRRAVFKMLTGLLKLSVTTLHQYLSMDNLHISIS